MFNGPILEELKHIKAQLMNLNQYQTDGQQKLLSYAVANDDTGGTTKYYGYTKSNGWWVIQQVVNVSGVNTYAYCSGNSSAASGSGSYSNAWINRATNTYSQFPSAF